jgi:hypothetical protein
MKGDGGGRRTGWAKFAGKWLLICKLKFGKSLFLSVDGRTKEAPESVASTSVLAVPIALKLAADSFSWLIAALVRIAKVLTRDGRCSAKVSTD